jgi:hypothetical protein
VGGALPYATPIPPLSLWPPPGLLKSLLRARGEDSRAVLYPKLCLKTGSPIEIENFIKKRSIGRFTKVTAFQERELTKNVVSTTMTLKTWWNIRGKCSTASKGLSPSSGIIKVFSP